MYYMSPTSNITPALVSVAMSRSDSRDSNYSTRSTVSAQYQHFAAAPMTVSYSTSPSSYRLTRTISNTSSSPSTASSRRPSSIMQRQDSASQWIATPYRSCQLQGCDEPSSYLSDDDLLYIAPPTSQPRALPVEAIPGPGPILGRKELTTEQQIAMLREMQDKEQSHDLSTHQPRRHPAALAQKAVRFTETKPRRPSQPRRKPTSSRKGTSSLHGSH